MKYKFITILHFMRLDKRLNKGIELSPGTRITNGPEVKSEILDTNLLRKTAGTHSTNEFKNTVYFYKTGEFPSIKSYDEIATKGQQYTFYFLREAQSFTTDLWMVKDNGIYVRDGFLITYNDSIDEGICFKASLTETFRSASGSMEQTTFTKDEINSATEHYRPYLIDDISDDDYGKKYPDFGHFYKKTSPERMRKAAYFTLAARTNAACPMKIVLYCTALECLFSTSKAELTHRTAERVAALLGGSSLEKKDYYKFIKKAYDYRSTTIHGSNLKDEETLLMDTAIKLDDILRKLILGNHEVFTKKDEEIDDFFINLILQ